MNFFLVHGEQLQAPIPTTNGVQKFFSKLAFYGLVMEMEPEPQLFQK